MIKLGKASKPPGYRGMATKKDIETKKRGEGKIVSGTARTCPKWECGPAFAGKEVVIDQMN